jgi:uncharacterized coiled-coil protein SlyX
MSKFSKKIINQITIIQDNLTMLAEEFQSTLENFNPSNIEDSRSTIDLALAFKEQTVSKINDILNNTIKEIKSHHKCSDKVIGQLNGVNDELNILKDEFLSKLETLGPNELENSQAIMPLILNFEEQLVGETFDYINHIMDLTRGNHSHDISTKVRETIELIGEMIIHD